MIVFPNCKINLGLSITAKRPDGYHDIETAFFPIPFYDILEIIPGPNSADCSLEQTGLHIAGSPEHNLCVKAYHLLKKDFPTLPPITLYLHKQIPTGAGLGGGSADGAFMLQALVKKFQLSVSTEQLKHYALLLGSDCPFFIENKPMLATGRGENMRPLEIDLTGWQLVLLLPGLSISTKEVFSGCTPRMPAHSIEQVVREPVSTWRDQLVNQFEETVFLHHPLLESAKQSLYAQGAVYASMTGTGSTLYGLFSNAPNAATLREQCGCEVRVLQLY